MLNRYILETVAELRQEELLRDAQRRRLIDEAIAGGRRSTGRPSIQQRTRMAARAMFAMVQTVLSRQVG